jgi:hypothetical protein
MANVSDPAPCSAAGASCGVAAVSDGAVLSSVFPEQAMKERARAAARSLSFISIPFGVGAASGAGFYDEPEDGSDHAGEPLMNQPVCTTLSNRGDHVKANSKKAAK